MSDKKTIYYGFRATPEEGLVIEGMVATSGLSRSDFMRKKLGLKISGRINSETGVISLNHDDPAQLDRE